MDKEWEKLEKIPAWDLTKVRNKSEVIDEARTKGRKVRCVSLMDICHVKNAELKAKHQKYKGRVVLRGDMVKDVSGSHAVFTEQGSSASRMTAAKVMNIISRPSGCAGQEADAVSVVCIPNMSTFRAFPSLCVSLCLLARLYTAIHRPPAQTHLHVSQAPSPNSFRTHLSHNMCSAPV